MNKIEYNHILTQIYDCYQILRFSDHCALSTKKDAILAIIEELKIHALALRSLVERADQTKGDQK